MENKKIIEVENVSFSYEKGKEILHEISAKFTPGKITAIIGPNGCGKSTLLNLIAGVYKPNSGRILLNNEDLSVLKRNFIARNIAVVHQSNTAPADMTVEKLVMTGRTPYRKRMAGFSNDDEAAVADAMKITDISEFSDNLISALSGGQLQRVWLAMALCQQTGILLLDEITTFLDIHYQLEIMELIKKLNKINGITIIAVLHDINLAVRYCDEVMIMKNGRIISFGESEATVTKENLDNAFNIDSQIFALNNSICCTFSRKGDENG